MAEPSATAKAWALYDRIIERAAPGGTYSSPWNGKKRQKYEPDIPVLEDLLGAALAIVPDGKTQSGVAARALDVWIAYELRRAGFDPESVWPRATAPRVVPTPISDLLSALPARDSKPLRDRIEGSSPPSGIVGADANILGKNYVKQVDVVMSAWDTGPQVLISSKRMDSSFGKNAANRVEESYGDAKNLRGRHPLAALGFVFGIRSTVLETEPSTARWITDLLQKLGREDDAYDAVCMLMLDYGGEALNEDEEYVNPLAMSGAADVDEPVPDVPAEALDAQLATLPRVRILRDKVPVDLDPAMFLKTIVEHVLTIAPITLHTDARIRRGWPHVEPKKRTKRTE